MIIETLKFLAVVLIGAPMVFGALVTFGAIGFNVMVWLGLHPIGALTAMCLSGVVWIFAIMFLIETWGKRQ
jgi:hypothetical protein